MTKELKKVKWDTDQDTIRMGLEFCKVNTEKRLVSGWATLDNVDTQNDIVTAEASVKAFSRARGNLREMHKKDDAVGRIVSFKEDTFTDPEGNTHRGIFVTAYVSKGAPNTWEKVLDKTLTGFSIGGNIIEAEDEFSKDAGGTIRKITDYDLTELSLVDNPGNQYANVFHIQKSADGSVTTIEGMAAETDITNVFYCEDDQIIKRNEEDSVECPVCNDAMKNVGWVENTSDSDRKAAEMVAKMYASSENSISKGGDTVSVKDEEQDESVATGHEAGDPDEIPVPTTRTDEEEAKEEEVVEEVHDEEEEILKRIDDLKEVVHTTLASNKEETVEAIDKLHSDLTELQKSFDQQTSEFEKRFKELDENWETAKSALSGFEKSLDSINSRDSVRKSVDSEGLTERTTTKHEDPWRDSAFSVKGIIG